MSFLHINQMAGMSDHPGRNRLHYNNELIFQYLFRILNAEQSSLHVCTSKTKCSLQSILILPFLKIFYYIGYINQYNRYRNQNPKQYFIFFHKQESIDKNHYYRTALKNEFHRISVQVFTTFHRIQSFFSGTMY